MEPKINAIIIDDKAYVATKDTTDPCRNCDLAYEYGRCDASDLCYQLGRCNVFRFSQELTDKINKH